MKQTIAILLLLFTLMGAHGQHINAYAFSGLVGSQIEGDELKGFAHWNYTGGVGAYANLSDDGMWGFSVEAGYSCRGVYNNKFTSDNPYNIKLHLQYVDIPATVFFRDPYGGLRIGLGMVYSRLVAQPHGTVHFNPNYFVPDSSDMTFLKNDLAPAVEFRFTVWNNLKASIRYQYSIIPVKRNWRFSDSENTWTRDCYNSSLSFRLLWQFGEDETKSYNTHYKKKRR